MVVFECDKEDTSLRLKLIELVRTRVWDDDGGVVQEDEGEDEDEDEI